METECLVSITHLCCSGVCSGFLWVVCPYGAQVPRGHFPSSISSWCCTVSQPFLSLINYKVTVNKRGQLFTCSAISLAGPVFILQPFIHQHTAPVWLQPLVATARLVPINIMDLWVDVFLSALTAAVIYMLICHFSALQVAGCNL